MPREVPVLELDQINVLVSCQQPAYEYFHAYGIFRQESHTRGGGTCWHIYDETKDIQVRLGGPMTDYNQLQPRPGDVIRIHRLTINKKLHIAEIPLARNVVIWPAFQYRPKPISVAKSPSIHDADEKRRRVLEAFFTSKIDRLVELKSNPKHGAPYYNVCGRIDAMSLDPFGHLELEFTDGSAGQATLRVFAKKAEEESDSHFMTAVSLAKGDIFVATNVKYDTSSNKFNLSANSSYGRSLTKVDKSSIIGVKVTEAIGLAIEQLPPNLNSSSDSQASQGQNGSDSANSSGGQRRSARLLQRNSQKNEQNQQNGGTSALDAAPSNNHIAPILTPVTRELRLGISNQSDQNSMPDYTRFSDFRLREAGYDYYDIAGQLKSEPQLTTPFGNFILQIDDGSRHNLIPYNAHEIKQVVPSCLTLLVYSKQKETDTNEHVEMAKNLKEGDLIHVKNVRVTFRAGKVKLELSANKHHNKSINVMDKYSEFGKSLLDMIETPADEEITSGPRKSDSMESQPDEIRSQELRDMIDPNSSFEE